MTKPPINRGAPSAPFAPFGTLNFAEGQGYWPGTPGYGGMDPFAGLLHQMLGRGKPAAKPEEPALKAMPADIQALTSMTSGPDGRKFDYDGFLGGLFRKG
jgi:hypothetical protein